MDNTVQDTKKPGLLKLAPILLAIAAAVIVVIVAFSSDDLGGWKQSALCFAAAAAIGGVLLRPAERQSSDQLSLEEERAQLNTLAEETRAEFTSREQRLNERDRDLSERWLRYQEWFEYPDPLTKHGVIFDPKHTEQDQQVLQILQAESKRVYEKLLDNGYLKGGTVSVEGIRDDVLDLVTRIAKVYLPDTENPLLETSIEQLTRAISRTSLHLLVVLEQLPLDVKSYNINSAYGYVQKAVRSYGAYKSAEPWLAYLGRTVYVGRFVAGANPITLGAWWAATEIGKRGAATVIKNVVDQQAIGFLHDLIRVIGFEVAGLYSGDFRHRDPNWIYGTELTELLHRFPPSRESLTEALQQIAGLQLRNEYDRIFLYRCLASRKIASPQLSDPAQLEREDREQIVQRIEQFFQEHIHGQTDDRVNAWRDSFEGRFDTRLKLLEQHATSHRPTDIATALQALATFQQTVCRMTSETMDSAIRESRLFKMLAENERSAFQPVPSDTFAAPDLEPDSRVADALLRDMVSSTVRFAPSNIDSSMDTAMESNEFAEPIVIQTGHYFRVPQTEMESLFDAEYEQTLHSAVSDDSPKPRLSRAITRTIVRRLSGSNETPLFVYPDAQTGGRSGPLIGLRNSSTNEIRLLVLDNEFPESKLWDVSGRITARRLGRMITDDCELKGPDDLDTVLVEGSFRGGRFQNYFAPILDVCHFDSTE